MWVFGQQFFSRFCTRPAVAGCGQRARSHSVPFRRVHSPPTTERYATMSSTEDDQFESNQSTTCALSRNTVSRIITTTIGLPSSRHCVSIHEPKSIGETNYTATQMTKTPLPHTHTHNTTYIVVYWRALLSPAKGGGGHPLVAVEVRALGRAEAEEVRAVARQAELVALVHDRRGDRRRRVALVRVRVRVNER